MIQHWQEKTLNQYLESILPEIFEKTRYFQGFLGNVTDIGASKIHQVKLHTDKCINPTAVPTQTTSFRTLQISRRNIWHT